MWRLRTLASQILVGVLGILVVTIALGGTLYVLLTGRSLDRQYETRAVDIAATVAQIPEVRAAITSPVSPHVIQGLATQVLGFNFWRDGGGLYHDLSPGHLLGPID